MVQRSSERKSTLFVITDGRRGKKRYFSSVKEANEFIIVYESELDEGKKILSLVALDMWGNGERKKREKKISLRENAVLLSLDSNSNSDFRFSSLLNFSNCKKKSIRGVYARKGEPWMNWNRFSSFLFLCSAIRDRKKLTSHHVQGIILLFLRHDTSSVLNTSSHEALINFSAVILEIFLFCQHWVLFFILHSTLYRTGDTFNAVERVYI